MLKNEDLTSEISTLEDVISEYSKKDPVGAGQLKALTLVLKLLRNIRSNQTQQMKAAGINLMKSDRAYPNDRKVTKEED